MSNGDAFDEVQVAYDTDMYDGHTVEYWHKQAQEVDTTTRQQLETLRKLHRQQADDIGAAYDCLLLFGFPPNGDSLTLRIRDLGVRCDQLAAKLKAAEDARAQPMARKPGPGACGAPPGEAMSTLHPAATLERKAIIKWLRHHADFLNRERWMWEAQAVRNVAILLEDRPQVLDPHREAWPVEPIARWQHTCAGPELYVRGVKVREWLGTVHNEECAALCKKLNQEMVCAIVNAALEGGWGT